MTAVTSVGGLGPVGMSCHGWKLRWEMMGTAGWTSTGGRTGRSGGRVEPAKAQYRRPPPAGATRTADAEAALERLRSRPLAAMIPQARVAEWQTQWTQNP